MYRQFSTKRNGITFDLATINAVWGKAVVVAGYDPNVWRKDTCGAWMRRTDYGQTTDYGWEIDHIRPVSLGGGDELSNLQPLQWANNRHKSDSYPKWACKIAA